MKLRIFPPYGTLTPCFVAALSPTFVRAHAQERMESMALEVVLVGGGERVVGWQGWTLRWECVSREGMPRKIRLGGGTLCHFQRRFQPRV